MSSERITVVSGRLMRLLDATPYEGPASYLGLPATMFAIEFQLFTLDGRVAQGDYRGQGTVVKGADGRPYLLLGDPHRTATLHEYLVADEPIKESMAAFHDFRAGLTAGALKRRKRAHANFAWMDGYTTGKRHVADVRAT